MNYGWRSVTLYRRQESRPSPRKRNAKSVSEEALQIAEKRRKAKGKGERERGTHLNAEFQRIPRRDKKAFSSKMKSLSRVRLFATPWTVAYQAPPSMGFSRQEYWSGLPFPSPGDLPDSEIEPGSPTLQADALTSQPPGKPIFSSKDNLNWYNSRL